MLIITSKCYPFLIHTQCIILFGYIYFFGSTDLGWQNHVGEVIDATGAEEIRVPGDVYLDYNKFLNRLIMANDPESEWLGATLRILVESSLSHLAKDDNATNTFFAAKSAFSPVAVSLSRYCDARLAFRASPTYYSLSI
ncbi:hypothetical protein QAD02_017151 [Eretmocerus hayati]|uniref:Uncharacterized protein n=1 Tax=Eretmocerus hayati TaxID=131215 RepID=A0ACC2PFM2_9HYME|nr:hypothetical protein QAD02_017151 [Eretmocerus hayati]